MIQCLMFDVFWERNKNKNKIKRKVGKNRHHLVIIKGYSLKFQSQAVLIESIGLAWSENRRDSWSIWQDVEALVTLM